MLKLNIRDGLTLIPAMLIAVQPVAQADEPVTERGTPRAEMVKLISEALPPMIGADNSELVLKMYAAPLGKPSLREAFDPIRATAVLLGRGARLATDCRKLFTPSGDMDQNACRAFLGQTDGSGPYRELRYSKHMQFGDLSFINRPADRDIVFEDLVPVKMSDAEAYAKATEWLGQNFGVPKGEYPDIPADARNPFPVKTVGLAESDPGKPARSIPVEKLVMLQRGLNIGLGMVGGRNWDWVPAPGKALVVMDDSGVKQVGVRGWQHLMPPANPAEMARLAKSQEELINEIADKLAGFSRGPVDRIVIGLIIAADPQEDGVALLLPAVQAAVSSVPADLTEEQQNALGRTQVSTTGFILDVPLIRSVDETAKPDDNVALGSAPVATASPRLLRGSRTTR